MEAEVQQVIEFLRSLGETARSDIAYIWPSLVKRQFIWGLAHLVLVISSPLVVWAGIKMMGPEGFDKEPTPVSGLGLACIILGGIASFAAFMSFAAAGVVNIFAPEAQALDTLLEKIK